MIGDVLGGICLGVGFSALIGTFMLGRIATYLATMTKHLERIEEKFDSQQKEEPDYDAWNEEWRVTDAEHGWMPEKIDTDED